MRVSVALTIAACACGLAVAAEVLAHRVTSPSSTPTGLLPLTGFSLGARSFRRPVRRHRPPVVGICAMVFRLGYEGHGLSSRTASCVLPLFVTTLLLVPAAANVTTFLFLWELMAVTSLLLVLVDHRRRSEVQTAGQWYAVMTQFGAAALLVGLVLLATARREPVVRRHRRQARRTCPPGCAARAFVLAVVGFGSKAGMVPLHVWLPRAHPEAPGPVSALMSAAMVNLGIYGIVRVGDGLLRRRDRRGGGCWSWPSARSRPSSGHCTRRRAPTSSACWPTRPPTTSG